jgi:Cys-tRNA(Pro) deacylase
MVNDTSGLEALAASGLDYEVVRYERARSVSEAAAKQNIDDESVLKTLVVRRGEADYLFVLVPGDREMDWPKLRSYLGVSRVTMPDGDEAKDVTGYERGAITPLGAATAWPVVADARIASMELVSIGAGAHGVSAHIGGAELVAYLGAAEADVTAGADG